MPQLTPTLPLAPYSAQLSAVPQHAAGNSMQAPRSVGRTARPTQHQRRPDRSVTPASSAAAAAAAAAASRPPAQPVGPPRRSGAGVVCACSGAAAEHGTGRRGDAPALDASACWESQLKGSRDTGRCANCALDCVREGVQDIVRELRTLRRQGVCAGGRDPIFSPGGLDCAVTVR